MAAKTLELETLTPLHWLGIVAAAVSAVVHLVLGIDIFPGAFGIAFLVATVGFLVGIVAVLVAYRRPLIYLLGIPYTAGQIVMWFAFNQPIPPISNIEAVDKVAQIVLIVVLVVLYRREA